MYLHTYLHFYQLNFYLFLFFCQNSGFFAVFRGFETFSPCLYKHLRTKTNRRSRGKFIYFNFISKNATFTIQTIKSHKIIINCH